jgi:ribosomal protein S18 acetylase RimI-like enzyme
MHDGHDVPLPVELKVIAWSQVWGAAVGTGLAFQALFRAMKLPNTQIAVLFLLAILVAYCFSGMGALLLIRGKPAGLRMVRIGLIPQLVYAQSSTSAYMFLSGLYVIGYSQGGVVGINAGIYSRFTLELNTGPFAPGFGVNVLALGVLIYLMRTNPLLDAERLRFPARSENDPGRESGRPAVRGLKDTRTRRVTAQEAARLGAFGAELFRVSYGPTHPEPDLGIYLRESFSPDEMRRRLEDPAHVVIVAVSGVDDWCGYVELRDGGPDDERVQLARPLPGAHPLEIVRFYVAPSHQGRGVAQQLMRACDDLAVRRGADVIWLQAWQEAAQAVRFYQKAGLERYGTAVFPFGARMDQDFLLARPVRPGA